MLQITAIPAFQDNYIWLARQPGSRAAIVVDPGDATPVLNALQEAQLTLAAILITHHHYDHVNGLPELTAQFPVPVYGPRHETIAHLTHPVGEGDQITVPELNLVLNVLDLFGHTAGHIGYLSGGNLFCGDTLFAAGCGRLFDGTAEQLHASLQKISALPSDTQIYCTHEYTQANLNFASTVEPDNTAIQQRIHTVNAQRAAGLPSLPTQLDWEHATNPFLRCHEPAVQQRVQTHTQQTLPNPQSVFTALRRWKDTF